MRNYAIVIGIDKYANSAWNLDGAVQDALDFAKWAIEAGGVPPQNVRLLLSPHDGRVPNIPTGVPAAKSATSREIVKTYNDFRRGAAKNGQRLYFYYAGHGVSNPAANVAWLREPVLVPADIADIMDDKNLFIAFSDVLGTLAGAKPREQVFFLDACRDFSLKGYTLPRSAGAAIGPPVLSAGHRESSQFVLYATSLGEEAQEKGAGIFGRILLKGLAGAFGATRPAEGRVPPAFEVRFDALANYVKEQVISSVEGQRPNTNNNADASRLVLAYIEASKMPTVEIDVLVKPEKALQTCGIQVLVANRRPDDFAHNPYEQVDEYPPPAQYPAKVNLPPAAYYLQASAPQYQSAIESWTPDKPPRVKLTLKKLRRTGAGPRDRGDSYAGVAYDLPGGLAEDPLPSFEPESAIGRAYLGNVAYDDAALYASGDQDRGMMLEGVASDVETKATTGNLEVTSRDPLAMIAVWGPDRQPIKADLHDVRLSALPIGSYRVALILPEAGKSDEQIVEIRAGKTELVSLGSPRPQLGDTQMEMLDRLGIPIDDRGYMHPSEALGPVTQLRLASLLAYAAFAAHRPEDGQVFHSLRKLGVTAMSDLPPGASGTLVLVGVSDDKPEAGLDKEKFLSDGEVLITDAKNQIVSKGKFSRLSGFPAAAQFATQSVAGSSRIELRLPGLVPTRYSAVGLPDRITVLIIVAQGGGQFDVQQYLMPLPNRNRMIDEFLMVDPTNIRRLELAQRYYASGQDIPEDRELEILLNGKWLDPLLACIAGYSLVRTGKTERYVGSYDPADPPQPHRPSPSALQNMLYYFDALPDSHVLAGLCQPERQDEHFANAIERGVPIFSEGYKALVEWAKKKRRDLPDDLDEPARSFLPSSPWAAWTVARPVLLFTQGQFGIVPPGWGVLEQKRQEIERAAGAVGRIEVTTDNRSAQFVLTGFLAGKDIIIMPAHISEQYLTEGVTRGRFKRGISLSIDFAERPGKSRADVFEIQEVLGTVGAVDAAKLGRKFLGRDPAQFMWLSPGYSVLRVASKSLKGTALPEPLVVATKVPGPPGERTVCMIGYPVPAATHFGDPALVKNVFGDSSIAKRLQPGKFIGISKKANLLFHDCFTLPGSSGSPVIDLETMQVIGLEVATVGRYKGYYQYNLALALWTLAGEPLLRDVGVNFATT